LPRRSNLVGYVRWDARSDRFPPCQTIIPTIRFARQSQRPQSESHLCIVRYRNPWIDSAPGFRVGFASPGVALGSLVCACAAGVFWAMGKPSFWGFQISAYEKADRVNPPKAGVLVFTGSSSIRFWDTLANDMRPLEVINRGFGGSQIAHVNQYASRIIIPYRPRAVVLYAGDNDLSWPWSKTPEQVFTIDD
jgi:hypothetical protein